MKKISLVLVGVVLLAVGVLVGSKYVKEGQIFGSQDTIRFSAPTISVATTSSTLPIKVLTRNSGRQYAVIQNNSDTVVYLYFGNFTSGVSASTTVLANTGIRLNYATTTGSSYVISSDNLYYGDVWMATTTAGKTILVTEK